MRNAEDERTVAEKAEEERLAKEEALRNAEEERCRDHRWRNL